MINIYLRATKKEITRDMRRTCSYWHFLEDGTGYWAQEGCSLVKSSDPLGLDMCQCDHLTHFAEVLIPVVRFDHIHEIILEIISVVGACLSLVGVLLVALTALVFKSWRKEFSNKIWLQLCTAIFILNICFLVVNFIDFDQNIWCVIVGVALHYSVLVSFCWMLVAAFISYRSLVLVFNIDFTRKLLKACLFAWGTPCLIIVILLCVDLNSYLQRSDENSPTGSFCYPSELALWLTVNAPIAVILIINWTLFLLIVRSLRASIQIRRHGDSKDALRTAAVSSLLVFLFGLPWVFGLISYNVIAAYIFTLSVSFQGFILFVFFVLANKRTKEMWMKKLSIDRVRSVVPSKETSSTRVPVPGSSVSNPPDDSVEMQLFTNKRSPPEYDYLLRKNKVKVLPPFERPDSYFQ